MSMDDLPLTKAAAALGIRPATLRRHRYVTGKFAGFGRLITPRLLVFSPSEIEQMRAMLPAISQSGRLTSTGSPPNRQRREQVLALHAQGVAPGAIAQQVGLTPSGVSKILSRANPPSRRGGGRQRPSK